MNTVFKNRTRKKNKTTTTTTTTTVIVTARHFTRPTQGELI